MKIRLILHDYVRSVGSHLSWKYSENNKCQRGIQRKFFLLLKTSYFNGSCNVTLTFYDVTLTYTWMVSAVTCAVKENRWQEQFLIGSRQLPPFFRRCGHLRTPTQVSEDLKTPIKNWAILFFKDMQILGANWNSNPASSRLCTWRKAKSNRPNGTWRLFLNNGSYPPRQHVNRDRLCKAGSRFVGDLL